jgi:hypothetical protein
MTTAETELAQIRTHLVDAVKAVEETVRPASPAMEDLGAARAGIESSPAAPRQARSAPHHRRRYRLLAVAAFVVLVFAGAALAETSPWSDVPNDPNWASLSLPVTHNASSMVLAAVPQMIHCTNSMTDCAPGAATSPEDITAVLFFRAGENHDTASDYRHQLSIISAADIPASAFKIWTTTEVSRQETLNPVSCAPSDNGWTCSRLSPEQTIPGGTPIYLPQPSDPNQCYNQTPITGSSGEQVCAGPIWAWDAPNSQNPD